MGLVRADYDSPWKDILEAYFEEFMAFFFPTAYVDIDWRKGYEFLDKELQQVVREAEVSKRLADKLIKVWNCKGDQVWVLIHIEVQNQQESGFVQRMYTYNYRLRDRFNRPVASFAILGDGSAAWRPNTFTSELWGCQTRFQFPTVKLLDYGQRWAELEASDNPFATVVMAHLKTLETKDDEAQRQQWKISLAKRLFQKGCDRQAIIDLIRFIDWLVVLPEALEKEFWDTLLSYQEERRMKYVTSLERFAADRGRQEGLRQGVAKERALVVRQLNRKVGLLPEAVVLQVRELSLGQLEDLGEALLEFAALADLEGWLGELKAKGSEVLQRLNQQLGKLDPAVSDRVGALSLEQLRMLEKVLGEFRAMADLVGWLDTQTDEFEEAILS